MNIKNIYTGLLIIIVAFVGCKKEEISFYDQSDASIYFAHYNVDKDLERYQADSASYSFRQIGDIKERDTVLVRINMSGYPSSVDRPISIMQTNADSNFAAKAGVHYLAFDSEEMKKHMIIPANSVEVNIPMILLHDKSILTHVYRLEMSVTENEFFRPGIDIHKSFVVNVAGFLQQPKNWDQRWKTHFGQWGSVKMEFIEYVTGYSDWEFIYGSVPEYSYMIYLKNKSRTRLQEEYPNGELKEADGTTVVI